MNFFTTDLNGVKWSDTEFFYYAMAHYVHSV